MDKNTHIGLQRPMPGNGNNRVSEEIKPRQPRITVNYIMHTKGGTASCTEFTKHLSSNNDISLKKHFEGLILGIYCLLKKWNDEGLLEQKRALDLTALRNSIELPHIVDILVSEVIYAVLHKGNPGIESMTEYDKLNKAHSLRQSITQYLSGSLLQVWDK
ncbi:MAG: hypothetical protein HQL01_02215 [Nitrospirae bacterium]|nr:hypothetical protein [Nitrospirota bacterium]